MGIVFFFSREFNSKRFIFTRINRFCKKISQGRTLYFLNYSGISPNWLSLHMHNCARQQKPFNTDVVLVPGQWRTGKGFLALTPGSETCYESFHFRIRDFKSLDFSVSYSSSCTYLFLWQISALYIFCCDILYLEYHCASSTDHRLLIMQLNFHPRTKLYGR